MASVASSNDDTFVHLISTDEQTFKVKRRAAMKSSVVRQILETSKEDLWCTYIETPVGANELKKIICYLDYHQDDNTSLSDALDKLKRGELDEFDFDLVNMEIPSISMLYLAAMKMGVQPLAALCDWRVNAWIKQMKRRL